MKSDATLLCRLSLRSLTGQIIAVAGIALFVAQSINFYFLIHERQKEAAIFATSMASARIGAALHNLEPGGNLMPAPHLQTREGDMGRMLERLPLAMSERPLFSNAPFAHEKFSERAQSLLQEAYPSIRNVQVMQIPRAQLPAVLQWPAQKPGSSAILHEIRNGRHQLLQNREMIVVSAQMGNGTFLTAAAPVHKFGDAIGVWLIGQTLFLYLAVLIPLTLFGFWLARPLRRLKERADALGQSHIDAPLPEEGPQDVRDLTRAFNAMQGRVCSLLGEKDVMLGAIGHDLKTPLASLRLRLETLNLDTEEENDREKMIGSIEEMNLMLEDILMLARLGRSSEAKVRVNPVALVETLVDDYQDRGMAAAMAEGQAHVPPILMRPALIRRALRNLIDNAVQYGGDAQLSLAFSAGLLLIDVADHGEGIPADEREALFEPFQRTECSRNRRTGGSGLGLTIARAIARQHGGDVVLLAREGGGTIARLSLAA